jgi:hypothetical protein
VVEVGEVSDEIRSVGRPVHGLECYEAWRSGARCPHEDPCQALDCTTPALTTYQDGSGKALDLCEHHGDLLAVGFPLKPRTDAS